jgi:L-malate glycosyltransferase
MSPHKVAFIGHSYIESASRRKLVYLAQQTNLRLITPSWYPTPFGQYAVDFEFNPGVPIQSYPIYFLHCKRTSTRWFFRSRDLGLPQFQPDIIHVENEHHSWIMCQVLLCRKLFAPQAKVVAFSWDNLFPRELVAKDEVLEHLAKFNRQFIDFFITGNRAAKEILLAKGTPADKVEVIPQFGIDPEMFFPFTTEKRQSSREELGISRDEFATGYVGKLMEEKGLFDLIEAVNQLRATSQRKLVLVMLGKGELELAIRSVCAQVGLRLVLLPARKNHQVVEVMNVLDVLVLPTHTKPPIKEQFGRVLIEAMACGTPVIGSDCGEIPNVIRDAGLVFHEGDVGQLSACLRLCCDNEPFRLDLGKRGLERVLKNFTNLEIARRTLQIYEHVAGKDADPVTARMRVSQDPHEVFP